MSKNMLYNIKKTRKRGVLTAETPTFAPLFSSSKKMKIGHDEAEQKNDKDDDATEITQNNKRKNYIG